VIVVEKGIGALLGEFEVSNLEGNMTKLLTTERAIETLDKGLLVLLVRSSDPVAVRVSRDGLGALSLEL